MRTAVSLARVSTGSQVRNLKENCILENCIREKLYSGPCAPYGIPVLSQSTRRAARYLQSLARARCGLKA